MGQRRLEAQLKVVLRADTLALAVMARRSSMEATNSFLTYFACMNLSLSWFELRGPGFLTLRLPS